MEHFAIEIGRDDHAAATDLLARMAEWNRPPGREYLTAEATRLASEYPFLEGCSRAFFIKMTPGSYVHRHRDPAGVTDFFDTDHVVVTTNDRAFICWEDGTRDRSVHLEIGKRYRIVDRGVMHWAVNNGETDRVHLLIEYPKISTRRRGQRA